MSVASTDVLDTDRRLAGQHLQADVRQVVFGDSGLALEDRPHRSYRPG